MKNKLKLNSLNKIEKKNMSKVKGGVHDKPKACAGCLCSGGVETAISTDANDGAMTNE